MSKRVCTMAMVLGLLAVQAVPAAAGAAVLHSRGGDDEWGVEGIAAEQALQDGLIESEGALVTSLTQPRQTTGGTLAQLPLYFVENEGQLDERVRYYVKGRDKTLYFTSQGLTFVLSGAAGKSWAGEASPDYGRDADAAPPDYGRDADAAPPDYRRDADAAVQLRWIVKLDFLGANPDVQPLGQNETGAVVSYFKGRPDEWVTGLKTYSRVVYRDLWPGIDLEYSGTVNELKYQFAVGPGADPSQIKLAYRGADLGIGESGLLEISTPVGGFEDGAPYAYQQAEGVDQVEVDVCFELEETLGGSETPRVYGFSVGAYDTSRVLVLDPIVLFSCGYIGGSSTDSGSGIAVDSEGNAYIVGTTSSSEASFPDTVGPDTTYNSSQDAFVAKVRHGGTGLVYCGYIGGDELDSGADIAVDSSGCAYVTGYTYSTQATFPLIAGPDLTHNVSADVFVAKVSADGTALEYCGYIGGRNYDVGRGIAVDGSGRAYVGGYTSSNETTDAFPVTVGPDLSHGGGDYDGFLARVKSDGTALVYCGYVGGSATDRVVDIAVDGLGRAYVTGMTDSAHDSFPVLAGPDLTHNGVDDAYVARVRADGTALEYCGYIGGVYLDSGASIAVDSDGNAYVTGETLSTWLDGFPLVHGPDLTHNGHADAFVAKVTTGGTSLEYCGYIGGSEEDAGRGIAVDASGNAYVVGETRSSEATFPELAGPDLTYNGGDGEHGDAFVAMVRADGSWFDYCGYLGGSRDDYASDVALQQVGEDYTAYIVGTTWSSESDGFPVILGPDSTHNGGEDVFVARVGPNHAPTLGAIVPSSGSSMPGIPVAIVTSWRDIDGWAQLKHVYFHIGDSPSLVGNVTLMYNRAKHKLWIRSDDGTAWLGGCTPGENRIIANSQAAVDCLYTSASHSGTETMSVTWRMWFYPGFMGEHRTGLKCKDMHKAKAKGAWKGTWVVSP
jgi:hypothetical protein